MKADSKTEAEVISVLKRFARAYEERNLNDVIELFAPDPDVMIIGTGADEKRIGLDEIKAQVERDWDQSDASSFRFDWASVSKVGSAVVVAADATIQGKVSGKEFELPGRLTAALDRRGNQWLFCQIHFSAPMAGQVEGKSWPTELT